MCYWKPSVTFGCGEIWKAKRVNVLSKNKLRHKWTILFEQWNKLQSLFLMGFLTDKNQQIFLLFIQEAVNKFKMVEIN